MEKVFKNEAKRKVEKLLERFNFRWAILIAVLCTVITIVMIFVGISFDFHRCYPQAHYSDVSINAILGLGIFLFAFNGHQVFPTVQNDMRDPDEFKKSISVGFICKPHRILLSRSSISLTCKIICKFSLLLV